jgi:hypothetical protein
MKTTPNHKKTAPVLQVNEQLSLEEQIAQRAHELWQQRGGEHGNDPADWFRAEREIMSGIKSGFRHKTPRHSQAAPQRV